MGSRGPFRSASVEVHFNSASGVVDELSSCSTQERTVKENAARINPAIAGMAA